MNLEIETALSSWLRAQPAFDGVPVHTGQSSDEIPNDQPVIVVGVDTTEVIGLSLYKITASVVLVTPSLLEGSLELHSGLSSALRSCLISATALGAAFPAGATQTPTPRNQSSKSTTASPSATPPPSSASSRPKPNAPRNHAHSHRRHLAGPAPAKRPAQRAARRLQGQASGRRTDSRGNARR